MRTLYYYLGMMYERGQGVPQDIPQAKQWYAKAVAGIAPELTAALSSPLVAGFSVIGGHLPLLAAGAELSQTAAGDSSADSQLPAEVAKLIALHRRAAEENEGKAQITLGNLYQAGKVLPQDFAQSLHWYTQAARQGHAEACFNLGVLYEHGQGVTANLDNAMYWYAQAAEQGFLDAQFNLALMYEDTEKFELAARWFQSAAAQGDVEAQFKLGRCYAEGRGVSRSATQAAHWYQKAALQGHAEAAMTLAKGLKSAPAKALRWYHQAAEQGNAEAQCALARGYATGLGVPPDAVASQNWYKKAATQGHPDAQLALSKLYESQRAFGDAAPWYRKLAEQGHHEAQYRLGVLYREGLGLPQDFALAYQWLALAAMQGDEAALAARDALVKQVAPAQVTEGQHLARAWYEARSA